MYIVTLTPSLWKINLSLSLSLSLRCLFNRLDSGGSAVVPLDAGHSNNPDQVLENISGSGEDGPLLSGDVVVFSISPTPVVLWMDHPIQFPQRGGSTEDPLLSGDLFSLSLPVLPWQPRCR